MDVDLKVDNKREGCTCEPLHSSRSSVCAVHCNCYNQGMKIDGSCRRCGKYPLVYVVPKNN